MSETTSPQVDQEHLTQEFDTISSIIEQGVSLLKEENFLEAQKFFCAPENARAANVMISDAGLLFPPRALDTEKTLSKATTDLAARFWQKSGILEIGGVGVFPPVPEDSPAFQRLQREAALLCAEEWIHLLQDTKEEQSGFPLVSEKLRKEKNPDLIEVDVAVFLNEHGVPLKGTFWEQRAGRRKYVKF